MNTQIANEIYDILVNVCGASEFDRDAFVYNHIGTEVCTEWRFCGLLGFGGKLYDDGPRWTPRFRVGCYPEDRTPEREEIIKRANALLVQLPGASEE